jgi:soluble lytic murein transglycosylase-like protein
MDIDKVVKIRINIRPLRWLVNVMGGFMLLSMMACPAVVGNPPPPPLVRILSAVEQAKVAQVAFIELEIMSRPGTATDFPARTVATTLVQEAHDVRLDPLFVLAVIEAESNFDVEACSPSKAKGLMQILPSTFASLNPTGSIFDPVENVRAGTRYLALLGTSFRRPESILMAYNGGPSRTSQYLKAQATGDYYPISHEMQTYPGKVMSKYKRLLAKTGQKPANAHKLFRVSDALMPVASIGKQP